MSEVILNASSGVMTFKSICSLHFSMTLHFKGDINGSPKINPNNGLLSLFW